MSELISKKQPNNFIKYNDLKNVYEWYDEVNCQLTIYKINVSEINVTVNIYQSPILQQNRSRAQDNIVWRKQETYGREYMRIISDYLERVSD